MNKIEEPLQLAHIACPNRVIRSAVHSFLGTTDGHMTDAEYDMYAELAANRVGTIISGHCAVSPIGRANPEQINIFADTYIPQFRKAAEIIQAEGAHFIVQISHAGPRAVDVDDLVDVSARPLKKNREARALTLDEIRQIEQDFIRAAQRVQQAGADGVQLHAAHSYLLSRFIDTTFNQRTDAYGGSIENRFRIVENIVGGIQAACGPDFPIFIKINSDTKADDAAYEQDMVYMLGRMKALGIALAELSGVDFINQPRDARLYYLERAARLRSAVDLPMSLVGGDPFPGGYGAGARGRYRYGFSRAPAYRGAGFHSQGAGRAGKSQMRVLLPLLCDAAHAPGGALRIAPSAACQKLTRQPIGKFCLLVYRLTTIKLSDILSCNRMFRVQETSFARNRQILCEGFFVPFYGICEEIICYFCRKRVLL